MMESIKIYAAANQKDEANSFDIRRMEDIYDDHGGQPDEPHRHDFYIILLVLSGSGSHRIDFNTFDITDRQTYFISPGQIHQLVEKKRTEGYAITFSDQFLIQHNIDLQFLERLNLFHDYGISPPLELDVEETNNLAGICEQMLEFHQSDKKFKAEAIASLLQLYLVSCNNLCSLSSEENTQIVEAGSSILHNFKKLVEQHFRDWHQVKEYAAELNVTADHLNRTIKSLIGKSAKEYLQNRLIVAAKRMLQFSELTNKEIAFELGFNEPSHFSTFFKNCTGLSPSEFAQAAMSEK